MTARAVAFLRHLAGFAVAPAVAPAAVVAYELFRMSSVDAQASVAMVAFTESPLDLLVTAGMTWVPATYAVALALGIPIVLALRAARHLTVPWVVGVSAALAGGAVGVAILVAEGGLALEYLPKQALLVGLAAALAAGVSGAYCAVAGVPLRSGPQGPQSADRAQRQRGPVPRVVAGPERP